MIAPVAVNCLNTMTTRMRHMLQSLQYIINKTRENSNNNDERMYNINITIEHYYRTSGSNGVMMINAIYRIVIQ